MDLNGFQKIQTTLSEAELTAVVTPRPAEGENVRYVTIETDPAVQPSRVLNALAKAGLTHYSGAMDARMRYGPELQPLGCNAGSITFDDKNAGRGQYA